MPEYLSPGVYVEEIDAGPKPIEGVSTSTAGAVGVTARGPDSGHPILITSFADYVRVFGGPVTVDAPTMALWSDDPEKGEFWSFPLAIKGFFDNGGQRIYVRRVTAPGAAAATATLGRGVIAVVAADGQGTTVKLSSLIGISVWKTTADPTLTMVIAGNPTAIKVTAYDSAAGAITVDQVLPKFKAGRDYVVVANPGGLGQVSLAAKSKGVWGNGVKVTAYPMEAASYALLADLTIKGNDAFTTTIVRVDSAKSFTVKATIGTSLVVGDRILVDGRSYTVGAIKDQTITVNEAPPQSFTTSSSVTRVRYAFLPSTTPGATTTTLQVWGASSLYNTALVELEDTAAGKRQYAHVKGDVVGNKVTLDLEVTTKLWEGQRLRLIEAHFQVRYQPSDGPEVVEDIANVRLKEATPGDPQHITRRLAAASQLIAVTSSGIEIDTLDDFPLALDGSAKLALWQNLIAGDDALGGLDVDAFVGADGGPGKRTGIQALEDIDDISIVIAPSMWSSLVQNALIQHCELLKYRFAILDPLPVSPSAADPIGDICAFREGFDSKYAALYFPRIEVRDPFVARTVGLGPSGHMAGLYARVDVERGVHKAPANEVIRGIDTANGFHGLEDEITKREQDVLNPKGINALRFFPDRGTRVWGARTVSSDGAWKYINVRRLFIFVERSIDVGTQFVVFEPNDEKTWARVRQSITNFLTTVWRSGALFGSKADEAFFVRCDRTTMTQDDIDNGRLICVVGIAPVKPAEFVIFRVQQKLIDQTQP